MGEFPEVDAAVLNLRALDLVVATALGEVCLAVELPVWAVAEARPMSVWEWGLDEVLV